MTSDEVQPAAGARRPSRANARPNYAQMERGPDLEPPKQKRAKPTTRPKTVTKESTKRKASTSKAGSTAQEPAAGAGGSNGGDGGDVGDAGKVPVVAEKKKRGPYKKKVSAAQTGEGSGAQHPASTSGDPQSGAGPSGSGETGVAFAATEEGNRALAVAGLVEEEEDEEGEEGGKKKRKAAWTTRKPNIELCARLVAAARAIGIAGMSFMNFIKEVDEQKPELTAALRASEDKLLNKAGSKTSKLDNWYVFLERYMAAVKLGTEHMRTEYVAMKAAGHPLTKLTNDEFTKYRIGVEKKLAVPNVDISAALQVTVPGNGSQVSEE